MTDAWGIEDGFVDALGTRRQTPPDVRRALRAAMHEHPPAAPICIVRHGARTPLDGPGRLRLEDGSERTVERALPADLPLGYHWLDAGGATPVRVVVTPGRCHLPPELRAWGWAVQLPTLRSTTSWGIGDLGDLRQLATWSREALGAGFVLVSPLGAPTSGVPQQPSPYLPGSRRWRNPLLLCVEDVPGARDAGIELESLAAAGRELGRLPLIDRDAVLARKTDALERCCARSGDDPPFHTWRAEQGRALEDFAVFRTLVEHHRRPWPDWPAEHRRPDAPGIARFAAAHADRVRFHAWVQWCLAEQVAGVRRELPLVQDLPIGVDPGGPDAWAFQDVLAGGVRIGAPPDQFNSRGQDWGMPPFDPHALRAAALEPFVQTLRACLRHAGGLRVDHVMGLFRLWWIPEGAEPAAGGYVRYPADELLAVLALESVRARAVVIGEDLGTVEEHARRRLAEADVLSYRVLWFEDEAPSRWPRPALAAVTTHDLPTVAGLWTGRDVERQQRLGMSPNVDATCAIVERLRRETRLPADAPVDDVVVATYRLLHDAPSHLLVASLEDALGLEERPNMPGTTIPENWSQPFPLLLEEIERHPLVRRLVTALRDGG